MSRLLLGYNQLLCAEALIDGHWSLERFEDLNRLVESVVLYDEVVLLGDTDPVGIAIFSTLARENILRPITDKEVESIIRKPSTRSLYSRYLEAAFGVTERESGALALDVARTSRINPTDADRAAYARLAHVVSSLSLSDTGDIERLRKWFHSLLGESYDAHKASVAYFARGLIHSAIADVEAMDYAPDYLRMPAAALAFSGSAKPVSKALYDALSIRLESEVQALAALGMPAALFVPPLTTAVLKRGARGRDMLNEALELRRKFAPFRDTYREFEETLRDPAITLREKIAAKNRLFTSIVGIIEGEPGQHALNIRTVWDRLISSSFDEKGPATNLSCLA
jgi:hypothetical protein